MMSEGSELWEEGCVRWGGYGVEGLTLGGFMDRMILFDYMLHDVRNVILKWKEKHGLFPSSTLSKINIYLA
jgi:hypothetical protein